MGRGVDTGVPMGRGTSLVMRRLILAPLRLHDAPDLLEVLGAHWTVPAGAALAAVAGPALGLPEATVTQTVPAGFPSAVLPGRKLTESKQDARKSPVTRPSPRAALGSSRMFMPHL